MHTISISILAHEALSDKVPAVGSCAVSVQGMAQCESEQRASFKGHDHMEHALNA